LVSIPYRLATNLHEVSICSDLGRTFQSLIG